VPSKTLHERDRDSEALLWSERTERTNGRRTQPSNQIPATTSSCRSFGLFLVCFDTGLFGQEGILDCWSASVDGVTRDRTCTQKEIVFRVDGSLCSPNVVCWSLLLMFPVEMMSFV
jgi:hypothetical protein